MRSYYLFLIGFSVRLIIIFVSLFIMWLVYSGDLISTSLASYGVISCVLAFWISHRMGIMEGVNIPIYWRANSILYMAWLIKEIMISSIRVSLTIWQVKPKINPKLSWIKVQDGSDVTKALYANSITLTPGTVCVNVEKKRFLVHALKAESIDELKNGKMERQAFYVTKGGDS